MNRPGSDILAGSGGIRMLRESAWRNLGMWTSIRTPGCLPMPPCLAFGPMIFGTIWAWMPGFAIWPIQMPKPVRLLAPHPQSCPRLVRVWWCLRPWWILLLKSLEEVEGKAPLAAVVSARSLRCSTTSTGFPRSRRSRTAVVVFLSCMTRVSVSTDTAPETGNRSMMAGSSSLAWMSGTESLLEL
jgi:hypothetical protein